jgi:hypothetical protein
MATPDSPERDPAEWIAASRYERTLIVERWLAEWAHERAQGSAHPAGSLAATTPPLDELHTEFLVELERRAKATYGISMNAPLPDAQEPQTWVRLSEDAAATFDYLRDAVATAYNAAAAEHARDAEAQKRADAEAHPGHPYQPGSLNPLAMTPTDERLSLAAWGRRQEAESAARQLATAQAARDEAARYDRAEIRPGQLRAGKGVSPEEWLAADAAARAQRAAAREAVSDRRSAYHTRNSRPSSAI